MRVLVLGAAGMLGSTLFRSGANHPVSATVTFRVHSSPASRELRENRHGFSKSLSSQSPKAALL